jgi:hypothetical protein
MSTQPINPAVTTPEPAPPAVSRPQRRHATRSSPSPEPRRLSRRRVKALISIGQSWTAPDGQEWKVSQVWRKDGLVSLVRPVPGGARRRIVSFVELGRWTLGEGD